MLQPATICFCGLSVKTGVFLYSLYDLVSGVLGTIIFIAGLSRASNAPDFGIYEFTWIMTSSATGLFSILGGATGLVGLQKTSWTHLRYYRIVKAVQILLVVVSSTIVLLKMHEIAPQLADEIIEQIKEAAKEAGDPEPDIDRKMIIEKVVFGLTISSCTSMFLWLTLGMYALYMIHSLSLWFKRGTDPNQPQFTIAIPPVDQSGQVQYVTPLLQGQSPSIPLSIS